MPSWGLSCSIYIWKESETLRYITTDEVDQLGMRCLSVTRGEWKMTGERLSSCGDNYAWAECKTLIPGSGR